MKYYKIKLPIGPNGYIYPPDYDNQIGKLNQGHIYYDDETDGMFTLLIAIPNALSSLPENVLEVSEQEAKTIAEKYDPAIPIITNEAVVRNLEIKSNAGIPLTQKDLDALDPEKPELGFGMSKTFVDKINKISK